MGCDLQESKQQQGEQHKNQNLLSLVTCIDVFINTLDRYTRSLLPPFTVVHTTGYDPLSFVAITPCLRRVCRPSVRHLYLSHNFAARSFVKVEPNDEEDDENHRFRLRYLIRMFPHSNVWPFL